MSKEGRSRRETVRREKLGLPKETPKEAELREKYYISKGKELHRLDEKEIKNLSKTVAIDPVVVEGEDPSTKVDNTINK